MSVTAEEVIDRPLNESGFTNTAKEVSALLDRFGICTVEGKAIQGPMPTPAAQDTADQVDAIRTIDLDAKVFYERHDGMIGVYSALSYPTLHFIRANAEGILQGDITHG